MDLLTPKEASLIAGVPVVQLQRWAALRVGPPNRGTWHKPMYDERDIRVWREGYDKLVSDGVSWDG